MHWIVQSGFDNDYSVVALRENLKRMGVSHSIVDVAPFSEMMDDLSISGLPDEEFLQGKDIFTYGSITLSKIGQRLGWKPGSFTNHTFNYMSMIHGWKERCLNYECHFTDFLEALSLFRQWGYTKDFFVRPQFDNKAFAGMVASADEFEEWALKLVELSKSGEYTTLHYETPIVLSHLKPIESEYRFLIVDGKIVTGSQYKVGDRVVHSDKIDPHIEYFATMCVSRDTPFSSAAYNPARAFALDIAVSNGQPYVLEFGCINNVGLYGCDTQKFIAAIEDMKF